MANFVSGYQRHVDAFSDFVFVHDIDSLSDEQLDAHGYYRGFVCPHGHYIRNKDKHWCYECVRKIMNNNCGFDINYMHGQYKIKLLSLWERITIGEPDECWDSHTLTTPRVNIPSYRSLNKPRVTDNINVHKVIYHCAWGDVGSLFVTRTCKNKKCMNPLHMVSSWNRVFPPETMHPFCPEFDPQKLMYFARNNMQEKPKQLLEAEYKNTIQHPLVNKNTPDYDEEKEMYYGLYAKKYHKSSKKESG